MSIWPNSLDCTDLKISVEPAVTQNCVSSVTNNKLEIDPLYFLGEEDEDDYEDQDQEDQEDQEDQRSRSGESFDEDDAGAASDASSDIVCID